VEHGHSDDILYQRVVICHWWQKGS